MVETLPPAPVVLRAERIRLTGSAAAACPVLLRRIVVWDEEHPWAWSLSNLAAIFRFNLLTYRDLWAWLDDPYGVPIREPSGEQLVLPI